MFLIDKVKPFFGVESRGPVRLVAPATVAAAADSVLGAIASFVVDKKVIRSQLDKMEELKKLPPEVRSYPYYLKLYLQLERLIVKSEPSITKEKYDEKGIREAIKKKIEVFKLKKPILYAFLDEDELNLSFLYDLINAFTAEIFFSLKKDSISRLDKTYKAVPLFEEVRFSSIGLFPFEPLAQRLKKAKTGKGIRLSYAISPIFTATTRFLGSIYFEAVACSGEKQARGLLKKTYESVEKSYNFLPSLPDINKYLPPGVFEVLGVKISASVSASASASAVTVAVSITDKLMNYIINIVTKKSLIEKELKRFEECRRLIYHEREDAYLPLYLKIENIITSHKLPDVKKKYSIESLRKEIAVLFNIQRMNPKFAALFRIKESESMLVLELMVKSIIKQFLAHKSPKSLQDVVDRVTEGKLIAGIKIEKDRIDFRIPERKIFSLPCQWHKLITSNFEHLIAEIHSLAQREIGATKAKTIIEDSYKALKKEYGFLPAFDNVLKIIPVGVLEEEKIAFLSKAELEQQVKERTKELEEAKEYADNIIKSMIDALIVVDPKARIKSINKATYALLGYKEEEIVGKPISTIFEEEDLLFKDTRFEKLIKEGSVRNYDMTYKTKKGNKIPVSFSGSVMRDKEGELVGIVGIARDMREVKRLIQKEKEQAAKAEAASKAVHAKADELEKAYNNLRKTQAMLVQSEKLSALGQLGGGIAHELNSPLAGVLSLLRSYIKEKDPKSEEYEELKEMEQACDHMAEIIKNLSAFSRESTGEFLDLNVNEVIESTLSFSAHQLGKNDIKIEKDYGKNLPLIKGNKSQLQQIVINMLTNAQDAIAGKGVFKITTQTNNLGKEKFVEMQFSDTGSGINKENIGKIFDPFFTTKRPGKGVGLGLSITHTIVRDHKGEIVVDSNPGKGTTFIVRLPVSGDIGDK